eukprot:5500561-Pyramimonas_sp.AAC.1
MSPRRGFSVAGSDYPSVLTNRSVVSRRLKGFAAIGVSLLLEVSDDLSNSCDGEPAAFQSKLRQEGRVPLPRHKQRRRQLTDWISPWAHSRRLSTYTDDTGADYDSWML